MKFKMLFVYYIQGGISLNRINLAYTEIQTRSVYRHKF